MATHDSIKITPETIGHLLTEGGLNVPLSQRSYRWENDNVSELFQDINGAIQDGQEEYFIGSIVGIVSENGDIFIYDGQQRLATSMILIAAIRDNFFNAHDFDSARLTEEESLVSPDRETHEKKAHLSLNSEDNDFFFNYVLLPPDDDRRKMQKVGQRESHKRIAKAASLAAKFVETSVVLNLPSSQANKNLHRWLNFINKALRVIWVQVGDEKSAFTIFETMNDRGLRLSAADLLKNRLYAMGAKRREEIVQKWQSMTGVLETIEGEADNVVEYIRCFWITGHGHTRTKDLYDKIKKEAANTTKAVNLASDLESSAQDYAAILMSSHEKLASRGLGVRIRVDTLRLLGVTQVRPLLLAAFRKFSPAEFNKLLSLCVSWSVRTLLAGVPSGTLEGYYSPEAYAITSGSKKKAKDVAAVMARIIPDDVKFKLAVSTAYVAKANLSRYYLQALQRCEDGDVEPQYIPNPEPDITLEHILPKDAQEGWEHFTADEKKSFLHRLGNQALLQDTVNGQIGNLSYAVKKPALQESGFSLTNETGGHNQWGKEEIIARQTKMADLAVKTWPLI